MSAFSFDTDMMLFWARLRLGPVTFDGFAQTLSEIRSLPGAKR